MVPNPKTRSNGRVTAAFLILALLLCHGVYGAEHQLAPAHGTVAHEGHSAHEEKDTHPAGHLSGMAYAAVLLVFFIAAAAIKFVRAELEAVGPKSAARIPFPDIPYLPRGPTLHFLQVLRL